jgi:uncharacterized protein (TIGR03435 family)
MNVSFGQSARITATKSSLDMLVNQLSGAVDRPVLNKTGLIGNYDFKLQWSPSFGAPGADQDSPSIFTALQEQLGLKLESQKAPIEVLVVDRAEKPSEN